MNVLTFKVMELLNFCVMWNCLVTSSSIYLFFYYRHLVHNYKYTHSDNSYITMKNKNNKIKSVGSSDIKYHSTLCKMLTST